MPTIDVFNLQGQKAGSLELSEAVFGLEPHQSAMHQVIVAHLAACRQGTQSALTRSEVSGGGKKPWRQKGTGHARQGSTRAPQWRHGGMVFTIILSITEVLVKVFKMFRRSNKTVPVLHRGIKVRNRKDIGRDPRPCHSFAFA